MYLWALGQTVERFKQTKKNALSENHMGFNHKSHYHILDSFLSFFFFLVVQDSTIDLFLFDFPSEHA